MAKRGRRALLAKLPSWQRPHGNDDEKRYYVLGSLRSAHYSPKLSIRRPIPTVLLLVKRGIVQTTAVCSDTYLSFENRSANAQFWPANCKVHSSSRSRGLRTFQDSQADRPRAVGLPSRRADAQRDQQGQARPKRPATASVAGGGILSPPQAWHASPQVVLRSGSPMAAS